MADNCTVCESTVNNVGFLAAIAAALLLAFVVASELVAKEATLGRNLKAQETPGT
jgi:hypothetical protein